MASEMDALNPAGGTTPRGRATAVAAAAAAGPGPIERQKMTPKMVPSKSVAAKAAAGGAGFMDFINDALDLDTAESLFDSDSDDDDDEDYAVESAGDEKVLSDSRVTKPTKVPSKFSKTVNADEDALKSYDLMYLYGRFPLTSRVRAMMTTGTTISLGVKIIEFLVNVFAVVMYLISTQLMVENKEQPDYLWLSFMSIGGFYTLVYVIRIYSSPAPLLYIFSFWGLVDLICGVPVVASLLIWKDSIFKYIIYTVFIFQFWKPFTDLSPLSAYISSINRRILTTLAWIFAFILVFSGVFLFVAYRHRDLIEENDCDIDGCLNYYRAFWYMIVTVSTVGYGDIFPLTDLNRGVVIVFIITAVVFLPMQINHILDLLSKKPYGSSIRQSQATFRNIVVCGSVSLRTITSFLAEFFHPCHSQDLACFPLRVVILGPYKPSFDLRTLIQRYKGMVSFVEGDPTNLEDLDRVKAKEANAVFILDEPYEQAGDEYSSIQIVTALSVNKHCSSSVRTIVEIETPEMARSAVWDASKGIEVVCHEVIRYKMMAASCFIKGLSTFVLNLFRNPLVIKKPRKGHFMTDYYEGMLQGVYPALLSPRFNGLTFDQAAEFCYRFFGVCLIGLDSVIEDLDGDGEISREERKMVLFPAKHLINTKVDVGLVIAPNVEDAEKLSTFGLFRNNKGRETMGYKIDRALGRVDTVVKKAATKGQYEPEDMMEKAENVFSEIHRRNTQEKAKKLAKRKTAEKKGGLSDRMQSTVQEAEGSMMANKTAAWGRTASGALAPPALKGGNTKGSSKGSSIAGSPHLSSSNSAEFEEDDSEKPKHLRSLEEAIGRLLAWPPLNTDDKPHPDILAKNEEKILQHLEGHTLGLVNFGMPHILVCMEASWGMSLYYLVHHLRLPNFPQRPIVLMHPSEPDCLQWGAVGMFPDVYFVKGSPKIELDLIRAGVAAADKVLVLSNEDSDQSNKGEEQSEESFACDMDNAIIAANVQRLQYRDDGLIVEMQNEASYQYVRPKLAIRTKDNHTQTFLRNREGIYAFAPPYQGGKAFCGATLSYLTYSSFFNKNTTVIVNEMLQGNLNMGSLDDDIDGEKGGYLDQMIVPDDFDGKNYEELFVAYVQIGVLPVGLYRKAGTNGSSGPYVHTNPSRDTIVYSTDSVFIITDK